MTTARADTAAIRVDGSSARVEAVALTRVSMPIEPPMLSGGHYVASIDTNVVELHGGECVGVGYTFAFSPREADSVAPLLAQLAEPLVGEPVAPVRAHWQRAWRAINFIGRAGPPVMALSALDMALWDLHARTLGVPLGTLLGLDREPRVAYAAGGWLSLSDDELVDEARASVAQGFRAYKMRAGADWRNDVRRVRQVRDAIGPDVGLMLDANQAWDVRTAIRAAAALEDVNLGWLEEPVDAHDFEGLAAVRAASPMPVAVGETVYGAEPFAAMLAAGSADVLQPDMMRCGGITGMLEIAALARLARVRFCPHLYAESAAHLAALGGETAMVEYLQGWFDDLFAGAPAISGGLIRPGDEPGLGISLSADARGRFAQSKVEL